MLRNCLLCKTAATVEVLFPLPDGAQRTNGTRQFWALKPLIRALVTEPASNDHFMGQNNAWIVFAAKMWWLYANCNLDAVHGLHQRPIAKTVRCRRTQTQVFLGIGRDCFTVPAFMWNNEQAYFHATRIIGRTWAFLHYGAMPSEAQAVEYVRRVYYETEQLRRTIQATALFGADTAPEKLVGSVPLEFAPARPPTYLYKREVWYDADGDIHVNISECLFTPWHHVHSDLWQLLANLDRGWSLSVSSASGSGPSVWKGFRVSVPALTHCKSAFDCARFVCPTRWLVHSVRTLPGERKDVEVREKQMVVVG